MSNLPIPQNEFTVSEISLALKSLLEKNFAKVRVKGEISGLKIADSGHSYFSLKDDGAVLNAICWRHAAAKMQIKLEEGMEVICTGSISSYPGRSFYQINVEKIEISGVGALLKLLEQRKEKLAAEGLFAPERKQLIPFLPKTIAVITSPTGAVIKDIIHRIEERFPVHIMVWGVLVQGTEAAQQIADAINGLQNLPDNIPQPDVIIVARGGGSIEDLWPFNEEIVIRAAAASMIPIISAVGHETDTTLIDFVADKRAPTPTAAAEMAVPVRKDLATTLGHYYNRQLSALRNLYRTQTNTLSQLNLRMMVAERLVNQHQQQLDGNWHRLKTSMESFLSRRSDNFIKTSAALSANRLQYQHSLSQNQLLTLNQRIQQYIERRIADESNSLELAEGLLQSYSPQGVMKRGFAMVKHNDKFISSVADLSPGLKIKITLHDGSVDADVTYRS